MGRTTTSQWDFGELFPAPPARQVLSVTELTAAVKRALEREFRTPWVTGEISNFRRQSSGHCYFTLKDAGAQLSCVLFRGTATPYRELLGDGRKVVIQGELTVYEPRGQYQLVVRTVELQGVGALQAAFEQLKQRLAAEGLFAAERKRPLPRIVEVLGVVSSPTGAALRDVIHVVSRRNPALRLILAPCRVQGEGAAAEVVEAIARLNAWSASDPAHRIDVILVTRGGGSLEDLWTFNEEGVARAIAGSAVPVVSGIGHEIDFTISDFVADLRAATPSAAAEILTEGMVVSRAWVREIGGWLGQEARRRVGEEREGLRTLASRVARAHPRRRLDEMGQRLDDLRSGLGRVMRSGWRLRVAEWRAVRQRWGGLRLGDQLARRAEALADQRRRLQAVTAERLERARERLRHATTRLGLLSPQSVLERGFSITTDAATGAVVREAAGLVEGQRLRTRLRRGTVDSRVVRSADGPGSS